MIFLERTIRDFIFKILKNHKKFVKIKIWGFFRITFKIIKLDYSNLISRLKLLLIFFKKTFIRERERERDI